MNQMRVCQSSGGASANGNHFVFPNIKYEVYIRSAIGKFAHIHMSIIEVNSDTTTSCFLDVAAS